LYNLTIIICKKTYLRYFGTDAGKNAIYSKRYIDM
jgi:hypothetical protein